MNKIEDTFKPSTLNEVLLMDRIAELRRLCYERGLRPTDNSIFDEPRDLSVMAPTLHLAALVNAEWEDDRGIVVKGRVCNDKALGFCHYVSRQTLANLCKREAAQHLEQLHMNLIHDLARLI